MLTLRVSFSRVYVMKKSKVKTLFVNHIYHSPLPTSIPPHCVTFPIIPPIERQIKQHHKLQSSKLMAPLANSGPAIPTQSSCMLMLTTSRVESDSQIECGGRSDIGL
jgi:hypothetical protein